MDIKELGQSVKSLILKDDNCKDFEQEIIKQLINESKPEPKEIKKVSFKEPEIESVALIAPRNSHNEIESVDNIKPKISHNEVELIDNIKSKTLHNEVEIIDSVKPKISHEVKLSDNNLSQSKKMVNVIKENKIENNLDIKLDEIANTKIEDKIVNTKIEDEIEIDIMDNISKFKPSKQTLIFCGIILLIIGYSIYYNKQQIKKIKDIDEHYRYQTNN